MPVRDWSEKIIPFLLVDTLAWFICNAKIKTKNQHCIITIYTNISNADFSTLKLVFSELYHYK